MSRVGDAQIIIPAGVEANVEGNTVRVSGSKGKLEVTLRPEIKAEVVEGKLMIKRKRNDRISRSLHGLSRSLVSNMVIGVSEGWSKGLELVGVGYRAQGGGDTLTLSVGYSHPITLKAPNGINFAVTDNTKITISGIDKHLVGQVAANIRAIKPPEVYKGKGIRYVGEYVRRKAGKAGKAVGGK